MRKTNYKWEYLSITRFLLAFIVMSGHLGGFTSRGPLALFTWMGSFQAILGFLLISGFSIGHSLARNKTDYFKRRAQRIYPVYFASIILVFFIERPELSPELLLTITINIFFLNQVFTHTSFVGPAWTLSMEVWLYLLAPLLMKLSLKRHFSLIAASFIAFCIYQCGRSLFDWDYYSGVAYGLNLLFLSFIWVAGLSFSKYESAWKIIRLLFLGHFILNTGIQIVFRLKHNDMYSLFYIDLIRFIFSAFILTITYYVVVYNRKLPKVSEGTKELFNLLGNISYPLYLIHMAMFSFLFKLGIVHWFPMILLTLISATLFYYCFDFYSQRREKKSIVKLAKRMGKEELINV